MFNSESDSGRVTKSRSLNNCNNNILDFPPLNKKVPLLLNSLIRNRRKSFLCFIILVSEAYAPTGAIRQDDDDETWSKRKINLTSCNLYKIVIENIFTKTSKQFHVSNSSEAVLKEKLKGAWGAEPVNSRVLSV